MKALTSFLTAVVLPLLVVAHGDNYLQARRHDARQAPGSASSPTSGTSSTSSSAAPSAAPSISGSVPSSTVGSATVTSSAANTIISPLFSTNPTAVPLASITANETSLATQPLGTTEQPGSTPSYMSAPPLPTVVGLNPSLYPPLDKIPSTDSPEVQQWIQEVANTGVVIPDDPPNNPGGCANNTAVVINNDTCWWSCSGCDGDIDITDCPAPLTWGLTYDDGPAFYTTELLDYLSEHNLSSTIFSVGSRALEFPFILQYEYMTGHQIAVHTWSHPYLTTLPTNQIIAELGWSKKIMKDVLGVTPNMMRPPYGDIDRRVRAICVAMGLQPVIWTRLSPTVTFDTGDFTIASGGTTSFQALQNWEYIIGNVTGLKTGFIVLEHDLFEQTVQLAIGYILPDALAIRPKFNIVPVVICRYMPLSNAYIETNDNKTNPPLISGTFVTIVHPSATGSGTSGGSKSSGTARFSIGFGLMFITTVLTLLAGVYAIRF